MALEVLVDMTSAHSKEVVARLREQGSNFTVSEVSSYLSLLRTRGLTLATGVSRGVAGGAVWHASPLALELLAFEEE